MKNPMVRVRVGLEVIIHRVAKLYASLSDKLAEVLGESHICKGRKPLDY